LAACQEGHSGRTSAVQRHCRRLTPARCRQGTEITLNYGFKSNAELLLGYGFGVPDNPSEYVSVRLRQIPSGDKLLEQKNAIIERLALRKARITPHLPPEGLLAWFRFVACDDASRLDAATLDEDGSLIFDKVSVQNEIWALHLCATEVRAWRFDGRMWRRPLTCARARSRRRPNSKCRPCPLRAGTTSGSPRCVRAAACLPDAWLGAYTHRR
jgi:hypothetical protein